MSYRDTYTNTEQDADEFERAVYDPPEEYDPAFDEYEEDNLIRHRGNAVYAGSGAMTKFNPDDVPF